MLSLTIAVLAAAPSAEQAVALAETRSWDELYLAFAAAKPDEFSKADRRRIAQALERGCGALLADDAVMAYSLGEGSVRFSPSPDAVWCTGVAAQRTQQPQAAEDAFRGGLQRFPKDGRFGLELGRLLLEEGDEAGARVALRRVPKRSKEYAQAQALLQRAASASPQATAELAPISPAAPGSLPKAEKQPPSTSGLGYESSVAEDGRRLRANAYFRFSYFNAQRDFGQRAEYEGKVQAALEEARVAAKRLLGVDREQATDVILYSRAEFALHHGSQAARAVAGFYSESAIRMNDSAEITPRNQATLVHEYVHAVVDELASFRSTTVPVWLNEGLAEYIEWRYEGGDGPPLGLAKPLGQLARQKQLPPLMQLTQGPLIATRNPAQAYALAACAVRLMIQRVGMNEVLELIRELGRGQAFEAAFTRRVGKTPAEFDEELTSELASSL